MTLRNIFIDFGGVIVRTEDKAPRNRQAQALGLTCQELEHIIFEAESSQRASIGEIPEVAHWQAVAQALHLPGSAAAQVNEQFFLGDHIDTVLLDYLRSLRPGRQVCLISNAWSGLRAFITKKGFADVFDAMIISAEVGVIKPDPRIYRLALDELAARAEESVFLDDVLVNIEAARSMGMHAIHFTQPDQALEELKQLVNNHR